MPRALAQSVLENRYAVKSRSFEVLRYVVSDGYDGYDIFDDYLVIVTEDGVEADPVLIPICQIGSYDLLAAKMEGDMYALNSLSVEEQKYFMDKYNYYKGLYNALKEGERKWMSSSLPK